MRQWLVSTFVGRPICWLIRRLLSVRYRVVLRGLRQPELQQMRRKGGVLFLPNHPALIDPIILVSRLWPSWKVHPMIVESIYFLPVLHHFFKMVLGAVKVPNFQYASNSYKLERAQQAVREAVEGLKRGQNYVIYPAGRLRRAPEELIGGSSAVHELLKQVPDCPIVLVRTSGLWGSTFGWGLTGQQPYLAYGFSHGLRVLLKNLLFFAPRRPVTIEFEVASPELPRRGTRAQLNGWLERWYNRSRGPFGHVGEPISLVSYSRWRPEFPAVTYKRPVQTAKVDDVPLAIRNEVIHEICRISKKKPSEIRPEMHLFTDVGLDSLDIADLISAIGGDRAFTTGINYDMLTVGGLMALAADQFDVIDLTDLPKMVQGWQGVHPRPIPIPPQGDTIPEAFLHCADRMKGAIACADEVAGVMTYEAAKLRVVLIAEAVKQMPGNMVGIMLPSSVAAQLVILGVMLAGKIPVMINWTVGPRFLRSMRSSTGVERVITSWQFLDRLDGVDISPLHDALITLEALRTQFTLGQKLQAKKLALQGAEAILSAFKTTRNADDVAVILFTTGTESEPKGVPLSHRNILSNQRAAVPIVGFTPDDVLFSILPPFHSFGFSITGLVPLLTGGKAFYFPNPIEAARMAIVIERYRPTLICSAPSFLRPLFRAGTPEQLGSLRLFISGAEAAPQELFDQVKGLNPEAVLIEGYGITECAPILTLNRPEDEPKGVGRPLEGIELAIVELETHKRLPAGEVGLVLARGPNIFNGYWGEDSPRPFVMLDGEEWYDTGDLGSLDASGALTLAGRLKRFVKIGGEMISLPALEAVLREVATARGWGNGVREPRLAVVEGTSNGGKPTLHLFANFFVELDEANEALREFGFSNLARLSTVHHLQQMPMMGTGKFDYRALQKKIEDLEACER